MKKAVILIAAFLFVSSAAFAQRLVKGTVTDKAGQAIIGANVIVKGTTIGTITDLNGNYSISVPEGSSELTFSYTGFNSQDVRIGTSNVIDVVLEEGILLEETVVTAFGTEIAKRTSGVASSQVNGSSLRSSGEVGVINALAGKAAGINITSSSGEPGAGAKIQIRGATSISGDLKPLIVLDGVPIYNSSYYGTGSSSVGSDGGVVQQSRLNDISAHDIEKVEVLRGASAAAVWGSKAANGVISITTKKGKAKQEGWSIDVNSSVSFDQLNKKVPLQNAYGGGNNGNFQFVPAGGRSWGDKIANRPDGQDEFITTGAKFTANDGTEYYPIQNGSAANPHGGKRDKTLYDVYDAIFQTGTVIENGLGLNNFDKNGNIYFGVNNLRQDGIIRTNSTYDRTTFRLNILRRLNERLSVDAGLGYSYITSDRIQMGSNLNGLFLGGLRTPSDFNSEDYVGTYTDANGLNFPNRQRAYRNPLGANLNSIYDNPLWMIENINSNSIVNRIFAKLEVGYEINRFLHPAVRISIDQFTDEREDFFPYLSAGVNSGGTFVKEAITGKLTNYNLFNNARLANTENFTLNWMLGLNLTDDNVKFVSGKTKGFINPFSPRDLENGASKQVFNTQIHESSVRYYTTLGFGLWNQLYINAAGSFDYLSTLSDENNGVFYPAFDVAWDASKVLNINKISQLKLRAGWGQVGRGPDPYLTTTGFYIPEGTGSVGFVEGWGGGLDPSVYGGGSAINSDAGNPNINPEIKTETEFGFDLGMFKNRLNFSFTYYNNVTKDLILLVDVPESTGFNRQVSNAGEIKNKGIELEGSLNLLRKSNFSWDVFANYSANRNEVTKMAGVASFFLGGFEGAASRAIPGQQLGAIWGSRWARDENGKLKLDPNGFPIQDEVEGFLGDPNPDFRMGIGSQLSYKAWSLNFLFDISHGITMWNGTRGALTFFGRSATTGVETVLTPEQANSLKLYNGKTVSEVYARHLKEGKYYVRGSIANFGGPDVFLDEIWYRVGPGSGFTGPTEQFMEDASWARLRELTLSYNFSCNSKYIKGGRVYVTGRNLWLITDYTGNDPDQNLTGAGLNALGLDYFNNPSARSVILGVNLNF